MGGFFGGGSCGPPYTESYDHEFEPGSGTSAGGVNQEGYCAKCGVQQTYHGKGAQGAGAGAGGQGGAKGGKGGGGPQGGGQSGGAWGGGKGFGK
jgi:hypothetical protein